jgi:hypothetical protein
LGGVGRSRIPLREALPSLGKALPSLGEGRTGASLREVLGGIPLGETLTGIPLWEAVIGAPLWEAGRRQAGLLGGGLWLRLDRGAGREQSGAVTHGGELADGGVSADRGRAPGAYRGRRRVDRLRVALRADEVGREREFGRPRLPQRGDTALQAAGTAEADRGHRHPEPGGEHDGGGLHGLPGQLTAGGGHQHADRQRRQAEARHPPRPDQPGLGQPVVQGATEHRVRGHVGRDGHGRARLRRDVGQERVPGRVRLQGQRHHDGGVRRDPLLIGRLGPVGLAALPQDRGEHRGQA